MKTQTSMLSSLAIAALATVTLNSSEALAKGGAGGMRSFSAARTPIVVTRVKTFSTPSVKKLTTTKLSTSVVRDRRIKPAFLSGNKVTLNPQPLPPGTIKNPPVTPVNNPPVVVGPIGPIKNPPVVDPVHPPVVVGPIGPIKNPPVVVDPVHPPVVVGPIGPIKNPPVVVDPLPPIKPPVPPVVVNPPAPPVVVSPPVPVSVGVGVVAAPEAIEPPGCTYERSVRKLPGGGLQRVIVKICPDA